MDGLCLVSWMDDNWWLVFPFVVFTFQHKVEISIKQWLGYLIRFQSEETTPPILTLFLNYSTSLKFFLFSLRYPTFSNFVFLFGVFFFNFS